MTGAISVNFEAHDFAPRAMIDEELVEILLAGHIGRAYVLPEGTIRAAEGAAALQARYLAVTRAHDARFGEGWDGELVGQLAAGLRDGATASGSIPATDVGAALAALRAEARSLEDEARVLEAAARGASSYPAYFARAEAETIAANLDTALAEVLAAAKEHSRKIGALPPGADNLAAHRADGAAFDALERLVPRLEAIEAAGAALRALGRPWAGLDGAPVGGPPVPRLAAFAVGAPSEG